MTADQGIGALLVVAGVLALSRARDANGARSASRR
jgi:hypothetical protein